jgi:hypothetical protein
VSETCSAWAVRHHHQQAPHTDTHHAHWYCSQYSCCRTVSAFCRVSSGFVQLLPIALHFCKNFSKAFGDRSGLNLLTTTLRHWESSGSPEASLHERLLAVSAVPLPLCLRVNGSNISRFCWKSDTHRKDSLLRGTFGLLGPEYHKHTVSEAWVKFRKRLVQFSLWSQCFVAVVRSHVLRMAEEKGALERTQGSPQHINYMCRLDR